MENTAKDKGAKMAQEMSDFVNSCYGSDIKSFILQMAEEHRCLQQNFTRLCFAWIEEMAKTVHFDERNAMSVSKCKRIKEALEASEHDKGFFLPYI